MIEIELSVGKVEIVNALTWGMQEEIRNAMLGGIKVSNLTEKDKQKMELDTTAISKAKYKTLELCVKKITLKDGTVLEYSIDWMNNLSIDDGEKLIEEINKMTEGKKKS